MAVETSIVVVFGEGTSGGNVVVEIDPEHSNNLLDGELKSTFDAIKPDIPVILIHMSPGLVLGRIVPDSGSVQSTGTAVTQSRSVDFTMAKESDKVSTSYFTNSLGSVICNGTRYGTIQLNSASELVFASGEVPFSGVATIYVTFQYSYFVLANTPIVLDDDGNFKIIIYVYVESE